VTLTVNRTIGVRLPATLSPAMVAVAF